MNNLFKENPYNFRLFAIEDIPAMRQYFLQCKLHLSDYSAVFAVMWQNYFRQYFAIVENCLVFAEIYRDLLYFYYPVSLDESDEDRALDALENLCKLNCVRMHFTAIPESKIDKLVKRYGYDVKITNPRKWRDYIYNSADFVSYAGKKYSGQRNHVNKFKKLYHNYQYCTLSFADRQEISDFLKEFESRQLEKGTLIAKEEMESVYKIINYIDDFNLAAGGIRVNGKLVAFSLGEICGDMLIVHVEKALTGYDGVYATMANEFAKHNVTENITLINREDDAGDRGLRKSKLQYNPLYLADKFTVIPHRVIDHVRKLPEINSGRLVLKEIDESCGEEFYRLEYDAERNRYWGYDWRKNFDGEPTADYFLQGIREDFARKDEMPLGIFFEGKFAGEVVLHNFGYRCDCEIGVRLLPEYEDRGIAKEALVILMEYALYELDLDVVCAKCFKENERSRRALLSAGMKADGEDDTYYYFRKTAAM